MGSIVEVTDLVKRRSKSSHVNQGPGATVVPSLVLLGFAAVSLVLPARILRFD